jgi:hypothetical protein
MDRWRSSQHYAAFYSLRQGKNLQGQQAGWFIGAGMLGTGKTSQVRTAEKIPIGTIRFERRQARLRIARYAERLALKCRVSMKQKKSPARDG